MPARTIAAQELASLLGSLSHTHRIWIIEELRSGERDVNQLAESLEISHSRVSQHLAILRAHRLVVDRRDGRHVFYHLADAGLATWLIQGLDWISAGIHHGDDVREAVEEVRHLWGTTEE